MTFSLESLKPKPVEVQIEAYGETVIIPIMPLTYTEYHNAELGVERPDVDDFKVRKMVNGKLEDVLDKNNPEYIKAFNDYIVEIQLRRLAVSLSRGGIEELQGLDIAEQVAYVRAMDAGITKALCTYLEKEANHKIATRFQPVPEASGEGMHAQELDA